MKRFIRGVVLCGVLTMAGCMSLEERLASPDRDVRIQAEHELYADIRKSGNPQVALEGIPKITCDMNLLVSFAVLPVGGSHDVAKAAVEQIGPQDSWLSTVVLYERAPNEARRLALSKITEPKILVNIYGKTREPSFKREIIGRLPDTWFSSLPYDPLVSKQWRKIKNANLLKRILLEEVLTLSEEDRTGILKKLVDFNQQKSTETELAQYYKNKGRELSREDRAKILSCISSQDVLLEMVSPPSEDVKARNKDVERELQDIDRKISTAEGELSRYMRKKRRDKYEWKINACTEIIAELKEERKKKEATIVTSCFVEDDDLRGDVFGKMEPAAIVNVANALIDAQTDTLWNRGDTTPLQSASKLAEYVDETSRSALIVHLLGKIGGISKACRGREEFNSKEFGEQGAAVLRHWKKYLTDNVREAVLLTLTDEDYLNAMVIEGTPPEMSHRLLLSQKLKSSFVETRLAHSIDPKMIDATLYERVRGDFARKALYQRATPSVQKAIQGIREKAVADLIEKGQKMQDRTFVLKGFYLGMPIQDAKKLVEYYRPNARVVITQDNNLEINPTRKEPLFGTNIVVDPQEMYFCQADRRGRVYRLNFDKGFLKQWFDFDVQDWHEWAREYGRRFDCDFRSYTVKKDESRNRIYMHYSQPAYRYRNNQKKFMVTYYGALKKSGNSNVDVNDLFAGGNRTYRVGFALGAEKRLREYFENGDGAKEGTLRVEVLAD